MLWEGMQTAYEGLRFSNCRMPKDWSNLHMAAHLGYVDTVKVLIQNGEDVNAVTESKSTALHWAAQKGHIDVVKVLIQNGADVNAVEERIYTEVNVTSLGIAAKNGYVVITLELLCFGAVIDNVALASDKTELLRPIEDRLNSLRAGNGMKTTLMSYEERRFMWNLAFSFTIKYRVAAFKAYYAIRSFITYNGIFMGPGYDVGEDSIWRKMYKVYSYGR